MAISFGKTIENPSSSSMEWSRSPTFLKPWPLWQKTHLVSHTVSEIPVLNHIYTISSKTASLPAKPWDVSTLPVLRTTHHHTTFPKE